MAQPVAMKRAGTQRALTLGCLTVHFTKPQCFQEATAQQLGFVAVSRRARWRCIEIDGYEGTRPSALVPLPLYVNVVRSRCMEVTI